MQHSQDIVVGYDGSPEASQAVQWAARQAALRECRLHLVHCHLRPLPPEGTQAASIPAGIGQGPSPEIILNEGLALATDTAPGLDVQGSLIYGWPAVHLAKISEGQQMLVLGSRGIGGLIGLLVGSVSLEMAATAPCPVAVIRTMESQPGGAIVVAVDASGSMGALTDACQMAVLMGAPLKVLHVQPQPRGWPTRRAPVDGESAEILAAAVSRARELTGGTSIEGVLLRNQSTARAILDASRGASLIVMGTKGRGLIKGTIGSTTHTVLHRATEPVLVSRRK